MILNCPECHTKFNLDEKALGSKGRKLRCSNCFHEWHQTPSDVTDHDYDEMDDVDVVSSIDSFYEEEGLEEEGQDSEYSDLEEEEDEEEGDSQSFESALKEHDRREALENNSQDAKKDTNPDKARFSVQSFLGMFVGLALFVALFFSTTTYHSKFYAHLFLPNDVKAAQALVFDRVLISPAPFGLMVQGDIINMEEATALIPSVKMVLKNTQNEIILSDTFAVKKKYVEGQQVVSFEKKVKGLGGDLRSASSADLTFVFDNAK